MAGMKHRKGSERSRRKALAELHGSLDRRYRPEDVAELILQTLAGRLTGRERDVLASAARHSSELLLLTGPDLHECTSPTNSEDENSTVTVEVDLVDSFSCTAEDLKDVRPDQVGIGATDSRSTRVTSMNSVPGGAGSGSRRRRIRRRAASAPIS